MHYIHLDENEKPNREIQRWFNPNMKEVVRTEVLKLLDAGIFTQFLIVHGSVLYKLSLKSQESQ